MRARERDCTAMPSVAPSPRWAADAPLSRALVPFDDADAAGPSAWWACSIVCAGHQRKPPLDAPTVGSAAGAIEASDSPTLLTPTQLEMLQRHESVVYTARGVAPTTPSCSDGRASLRVKFENLTLWALSFPTHRCSASAALRGRSFDRSQTLLTLFANY